MNEAPCSLNYTSDRSVSISLNDRIDILFRRLSERFCPLEKYRSQLAGYGRIPSTAPLSELETVLRWRM